MAVNVAARTIDSLDSNEQLVLLGSEWNDTDAPLGKPGGWKRRDLG